MAFMSQPQSSTEFNSEIWNAWNITPRNELPQADWPIGLHTDVPTTFLIYTDGKTFGGKAIVDECPGYGDLKEGKVEGNRVSFTVIAHSVSNNIADQIMYYTGTINGDEMDLVMDYSPTIHVKMKAKKFRHD
jgi:hypothetical protein